MQDMKRISTILSNGTKVDYNVILTFKSVLTGKNYVQMPEMIMEDLYIILIYQHHL